MKELDKIRVLSNYKGTVSSGLREPRAMLVIPVAMSTMVTLRVLERSGP